MRNKQQIKSQRAQETICEAAITSLFKVGYGETTIIRVAEIAGVSKGALQYHYRSKEDLILATLNSILSRTSVNDTRHEKATSAEEVLLSIWKNLINTRPYLALLEILVAARTDKKLQARISDDLIRWGKALDEQGLTFWRSVNRTDEDVIDILNMTRSFMRGMVIQKRYHANEEENLRLVQRWIELISPEIELRDRE